MTNYYAEVYFPLVQEEECETRTTHEEGENETAGNPGARTAEKYTVPDTADIIGIESVEEIIRIIRGVSFIAGMHPGRLLLL